MHIKLLNKDLRCLIVDYVGCFGAPAMCDVLDVDIEEYGQNHSRFRLLNDNYVHKRRAERLKYRKKDNSPFTFKEYLQFFNLCPAEYRNGAVPRKHVGIWHLNTNQIKKLSVFSRDEAFQRYHYLYLRNCRRKYVDLYDVVDLCIDQYGRYSYLESIIQRCERLQHAKMIRIQTMREANKKKFDEELEKIARAHDITFQELIIHNLDYYNSRSQDLYYDFPRDFFVKTARHIVFHKMLSERYQMSSRQRYAINNFALYRVWMDGHIPYSKKNCLETIDRIYNQSLLYEHIMWGGTRVIPNI